MGIIYKITSPSNKSYIGQTKRTLKTRITTHASKHSTCTLLKKAIAKYGWKNMKTEIILQCNNEDLPFYEKQMIQAYDTFGPNGYNQTSGGEIGKEYTQEIRQKISDKLKEGWKNGTITHHAISKEAKQKRMNSCTGTIHYRRDRKKYTVIIPKIWSAVNKQQTFGLFDTKEEAEEALQSCKHDIMNGKLFETRLSYTEAEKKSKAEKRSTGSVCKQGKRWHARIPKWWSDTGKRKCIGSFESEQAAWAEIEKWKKND